MHRHAHTKDTKLQEKKEGRIKNHLIYTACLGDLRQTANGSTGFHTLHVHNAERARAREREDGARNATVQHDAPFLEPRPAGLPGCTDMVQLYRPPSRSVGKWHHSCTVASIASSTTRVSTSVAPTCSSNASFDEISGEKPNTCSN